MEAFLEGRMNFAIAGFFFLVFTVFTTGDMIAGTRRFMIGFVTSRIGHTLHQVGRHGRWLNNNRNNVLELFEFINQAGLNFVSINGPVDKFILSLDYLENFEKLDEELKNNLKSLSDEEQISVAEMVDGGVDNYQFFASKIEDSKASFNDQQSIPYIYGEPKNLDIVLNAAAHQSKNDPNHPTKLKFRYQFEWPRDCWQISWNITQNVKRMVDLIKHRNRTIEDVVDIIAKETNAENEQIFNQLKQFYVEAGKKTDILLLRGKNVPNFPKGYKMPLFGLSFA